MSATSNAQQQAAEQHLAAVLREASGLELAQMNRAATFLELGFDSLFLIQLSQRLKRKFGVKIAFRQLIEEVSTVDALIRYLTEHGNFDRANSPIAQPSSSPTLASSVGNTNPGSSTSGAEISIQPTLPPKQSTSKPVNTLPTGGMQVAVAGPAFQPLPSVQPSPIIQQLAQPIPPSAPQASEAWLNPMPSVVAQGGAIEQIILQQNQLMMRQLEILCGQPMSAPATSVSVMPVCQPAATILDRSIAEPQQAANCASSITADPCGLAFPTLDNQATSCAAQLTAPPSAAATSNASNLTTAQLNRAKVFERFGPYKPVRRGNIQGLTEKQHQHLQSFIERYTRRTSKSRQHAQTHRTQFADPRGVAGYRRIWKSMVYQIVVEKSKGSKLWDIDGNEYVDIAMGFGLNLFGQSPEFVTEALHRQLDRGVEVGPQTPLTGEVANLLCQFSRKDRATFCNTGSEAVMAALRLARTVTGKTKTVFFNKDYHGNFDQVLMRSQSTDAQAGSAPAAPGVPQWYAENTIVLPYGADDSLRIIEENADDIAAVLVEPCQSADPFIQPKEFLVKLRELTRQRQIALVMDEVITGFRAAQGGAQEWYGVWGDMATYGKILGGGMPIGALAGNKEYMDALDGGDWRYEDDSEPDADMTFFAGTFVRHPLAIAAAFEVLKKVKEEGPQLQQKLTERTSYLANSLNQFFEEQQFPIRVAQFTSLFRFMFPPDLEFADMLYFHLLDRGIFTRGWGDNCFLSTAHTDEDIERIIHAVKASCLEIREAGFFPDSDPSGNDGELKKKSLADSLPRYESRVSIPISAPTALRISTLEFDPDRMSTVNPIQEEGNRPPLFCMPAADGLTLVYHDLAKELGKNQPLYGLDSPAIYREPIPDTLEELAARFIADMKEVQPVGPYYLIGYCSGGTTALEVAHQLIRSGEQVGLLALLETYNWMNLPSTKPTALVQAQYQYERLKYHCYNFWLLDAKSKTEFIGSKFRSLVARTKVWKGAFRRMFRGRSIAQEGLVNMAEIWRKHDDIAEAYVAKKYPGKLVHFRPLRDYKCNIGTEYEADEVDYRKLNVYPAGMMSNPFVKHLAAQLDQLILQSMVPSQGSSLAELESA